MLRSPKRHSSYTSMADNKNYVSPKPSTSIEGGREETAECSDNKNKVQRHPRWTKPETLVLIEGKKMAQNHGRRGRGSGSFSGTDHWHSISSYCRKLGVNRTPVQCQKRWSNLVCDFKKIRTCEWQVTREGDSFWTMRNDIKRKKKLPGFFDKDIYAVLDGMTDSKCIHEMAHDSVRADGKEMDKMKAKEVVNEDDNQTHLEPGTAEGQEPEYHMLQKIVKDKHLSAGDQNINYIDQSMKVASKSSSILNLLLDTHRVNSLLEREQQKDYNDKLLSALGKISDAMARIADKL